MGSSNIWMPDQIILERVGEVVKQVSYGVDLDDGLILTYELSMDGGFC
jgi:hypothetical protein